MIETYSPWDIDLSRPVDWRDPLNRGLVAWWLAMPHSGFRGQTWRDLVGLSGKKTNHGTLTNGPAWQGPRGRTGGWGALSFDGSDDYVSCPVPHGLHGATAATVCGWALGTSPSFDEGSPVVTYSGAGSENWPYLNGQLYTSVLRTARVDGIAVPSGVSLGGWYHWCATTDGTTWTLYLNARVAGTAAAQATVTADQFHLSRDPGVHYWGGYQDDVRAWTRALSAAEVRALYDLSRRGHPGLLRRVSRVAYSFQDEGGGAVEEAALSSAGAGTASWTGAATASVTVTADGVGDAVFAGASTFAAALASAGAAFPAFVGAALADAALATAGAGAGTFVGASTAEAAASSAGAATPAWVGASDAAAAFSAAGSGSASLSGAAVAAATLSANGVGAVSWVGDYTATGSAALSAAGAGAATFAGASVAASTLTAAGLAAVSWVSPARVVGRRYAVRSSGAYAVTSSPAIYAVTSSSRYAVRSSEEPWQ